MEINRVDPASHSSFLRKRPLSLLVGAAAILALLMVWNLNSKFSTPSVDVKMSLIPPASEAGGCINLEQKTFYDDPNLSYWIEKPITSWDSKRRHWLKRHPSIATGDKILLVTGSQSGPCKNPIGDNLLLRLFKNKVDYCRIHGYELFYNNVLLHPKMDSYWAKIPVVRAAMVAHPEVEWIWWVDSDAIFTDIDFKPPLERYKDYNLVVGGSPEFIYEKPSWLGLNAGVFYIRNCQWSMDFMEEWAKMGPQTPNYEKWGQILRTTIKDKLYPVSDDQTAMVYLLMTERKKWGDKVFLEHEHCIQGYWGGLVDTLDNITRNYVGIERRVERLRRRHGEKVSEGYGELWEKYLEDAGYRKDAGKRPCITHFTGCQPCSGDYNPMYTGDSCWKGMEKALNFANNQVLRNYGFVHPDLLDASVVSPLPFNFPQ